MTTHDRGAVAPARAALSTPEARARIVTPVALTIIALSSGLHAWAIYLGWFYGDDFPFLSDVARGKVDPEWFIRRYNVQFLPLGFLMVVPVALAGSFVWAAAATEIVLFQLINSFACWFMLRTLFGNKPRILVPLTFYAFSAITMPALMWWSGSISLLTVQAPTFLGIAAHVIYLRSSKKRYAIAAAACMAIALGFYVKAMFFPVALGIFTLVYFVAGPPRDRIVDAVKRWWLVWLLYAAIGSAYLVGYWRLGGSPAQTDGKVNVADAFQQQVFGALGTGLLGGPWSWVPVDAKTGGPRQLADPSQLVQILSTVTLLLLLMYFAGRYKGALRPLWFVVPCIAVTFGALAVGRVAQYGANATQELRYWADTLPYFTLAVGLMCLVLPGTPRPLTLREDPIIARRLPRKLVAGLASIYVIGAIVSSVTYANPWHESNARDFIRTATSQLNATPVPVQLADEYVPESVVSSLFFPDNLASRVLAPVGERFTTPDVANDIHVLDGYGQVVPGWSSPDLQVPASNLTACLEAQDAGAVTTIDLGAPTFDYPFWASVTYRASATAPVVVMAGEKRYNTTFLSGLHTLSFRTVGSFTTISFSLPSNTRVCLESIRIGQHVVGR